MIHESDMKGCISVEICSYTDAQIYEIVCGEDSICSVFRGENRHVVKPSNQIRLYCPIHTLEIVTCMRTNKPDDKELAQEADMPNRPEEDL